MILGVQIEFTQRKRAGLVYYAFSAGLFCFENTLIPLLFESKFCEEQGKVMVKENVNNHYEAGRVYWCFRSVNMSVLSKSNTV